MIHRKFCREELTWLDGKMTLLFSNTNLISAEGSYVGARNQTTPSLKLIFVYHEHGYNTHYILHKKSIKYCFLYNLYRS